MNLSNLESRINEIWDNRELLTNKSDQQIVRDVLALLDKGKIRVCEPVGEKWQVNQWIK